MMGKLLSVAEAAARLTVSKRTVQRWLAEREIPFVRVKRYVRIAEDDVLAFLRRHWQRRAA